MRKLKIVIFLAISFCLMPRAVNAVCSNSEIIRLNGLANNIKADYTLHERMEKVNLITDGGIKNTEEKVEYFNVNIYNITDDFYIKVSNDYDDSIKTYQYSDANKGVIRFEDFNINNVIEYKIAVYIKNSECGDLVRTISLTTPRHNRHFYFPQCKDAEEYFLCQKFVTYEVMSDSEFETRITKYLAKEESPNKKGNDDSKTSLAKFFSFVIQYWYFFGGGLVIIGIIILMVILKRRRKRI